MVRLRQRPGLLTPPPPILALTPVFTRIRCIESCGATPAETTLKADTCFIDNMCFTNGEIAELLHRPCQQCNAATSTSSWSHGPSVGVSHCFIDGECKSGSTNGDPGAQAVCIIAPVPYPRWTPRIPRR